MYTYVCVNEPRLFSGFAFNTQFNLFFNFRYDDKSKSLHDKVVVPLQTHTVAEIKPLI